MFIPSWSLVETQGSHCTQPRNSHMWRITLVKPHLVFISHASQSVGWQRLKYLNHFRMDRHEILYRHSWFPEDESYRLCWSLPHAPSLTFVILSKIPLKHYWMIAIKLGTDIHGPLRMTFGQNSGQNFYLSSTLIYDQISAKKKTAAISLSFTCLVMISIYRHVNTLK